MIKVIACSIFKIYIEQLDIDLSNYQFTYLEINQHNQPNLLASKIQEEIDLIKDAERIIILYGLCGNALLSIKAISIPLTLIKVHDCLSVLLGSKQRFNEQFGHRLSSSWTCLSLKKAGYDLYQDDKYEEWLELYDEETANYLKETLSSNASIYISFNLADEQINDEFEVIKGDLSFLKDILTNKSKELIDLYNNQSIVISNDINDVFKIKGEK